MAVLPQFEPMQAPGTQAGLALQGENDASNWMTQAASRQQMQANTEQTQLHTALLRAQMPVLQAKNTADALALHNDIISATAMQQYRAQWQTLKPQVVNDMAAIEEPTNQAATEDGTPDWEDKYHQYEALQSKYGQLSLFPEGKQYYQMLEDRKKNAFSMAVSHNTAQAALDRTNAMVGGRESVAETTAGTRVKTAEIGAGARVQAAGIGAEGKTDAANINATGGMNRTLVHEFSKAADDYENFALKEPDPDRAAQFMAKANQFRAKAQQSSQAPNQPAPDANANVSVSVPNVATPAGDATATETPETPVVAPTVVPKDAPSVSIGGKSYPVFKDKAGNRAYKIDGHYVPIETQ